MGSEERINLVLDIINIGKIQIQAMRINAPRTLERLLRIIPFSSRAIKRGVTLTFTSELKAGPENTRNSFVRGDFSLDPSSGNMILHLAENQGQRKMNFIGTVTDGLEIVDSISLTNSVVLKSEDSVQGSVVY